MASRGAGLAASSRTLDALVIAVTLVLAGSAVVQGRPFEPTPLRLGASLLCCVAILWRQQHPVLVLAIAVAGLVAGQPAPVVLAAGTVTEVLGPRPRAWIVLGIASVPVLALVAAHTRPLTTLLSWGALVVFPATVGLYVQARQAAAAERAREATRQAAERARQDERRRIAREMHDVVAHQVSLIALQAGALEVTVDSPEAVAAAGTIRQTARQALEELRHVVGLLRTDGDAAEERTPHATLDRLGALVEEWHAAGVDVELHDRTAPGFLAGCSPGTGRTAYRVVREALTNVSKHAAGAAVTVELAEADGGLRVEVCNTAGTRVSSRAGTGAGVGLFGLRERVELLGCRLEAGPDGRGGYRVCALLPVGEAET